MTIILDGTTGITTPVITTPGASINTNISYTGTLTGGTGVVNLGSWQLVKDAGGNLGVGTASPAQKLDVQGGNVRIAQAAAASGASLFLAGNGNTTGTTSFDISQAADNAAYIFQRANSFMAIGTNNTEAIRITSGQNVGIGTALPSAKLDVNGSARLATTVIGVDGSIEVNQQGTGDRVAYIDFHSSGTPGSIDCSARAIRQAGVNGSLDIQNAGTGSINLMQAGAGAIVAFTNGSEKMRLDASGNLLVGATSGSDKFNVYQGVGGTIARFESAGTSAAYAINFKNPNGSVGNVTTNGSSTTYNTTSDYRLKTVIGPVADAGSRIDSLLPVEYEWKADGARTRGFLAHQFQEVYAGSVTGEKDAVDEDGKPVYQSMQASSSEVIADLVAEIQSLRKRLTALENK